LISPLDVRNQVFKKMFRGYDADEVRIFLDAVADRMEDMIKNREDLERENAVLKEKNKSFTEIEISLRNTMVTAQRICDESKVAAQREADNIVRQAELDARTKVADVSGDLDHLARQRQTTRAETMAFIAKLKSLLEGHLSFLGSIEREVRDDPVDQPSGEGEKARV
jgi:cell division initiation protein